MAVLFNIIMWLGIFMLGAFLILSTYRIISGRSSLPFMTFEQEREHAPKAIVVIMIFLMVGYAGLSYLKGGLL